jgi:hypothetical protein
MAAMMQQHKIQYSAVKLDGEIIADIEIVDDAVLLEVSPNYL